eukprot:EG_transcript_38858
MDWGAGQLHTATHKKGLPGNGTPENGLPVRVVKERHKEQAPPALQHVTTSGAAGHPVMQLHLAASGQRAADTCSSQSSSINNTINLCVKFTLHRCLSRGLDLDQTGNTALKEAQERKFRRCSAPNPFVNILNGSFLPFPR